MAIPIVANTKATKVFNPGLCAMATLIGSYDELPSVHTKLHAWIKEKIKRTLIQHQRILIS
ncbi:hypothetical protein [Lysinibacillus parviboronicapiens]|uniref:hypothetical protein n=1 Tax=Lysinibacillus parviboronicapiens TaxID=436516 RepID=UPI001EE71978|nr:hypothetical protein [Lysinibacillus parviboronicapiens]